MSVLRIRRADAPISSSAPSATARSTRRIFLLSPANAGGIRAKMLMSENARFALASRLRSEGLPIGELFSFISGLYFRGKVAYAEAFARPAKGSPGIFVITGGRGLIPTETLITRTDLLEIAAVPVDASEPRYRLPLDRDARTLSEIAGEKTEVILLGSIATSKYGEPLLAHFGERLLFPSAFVGRGDMSRGGLMLRAARENVELLYEPVHSAVRHGTRPPKLPKLPRVTSPSETIPSQSSGRSWKR